MVDFLPTSERQARPLAALEPEEQIEAWKRARFHGYDNCYCRNHLNEENWVYQIIIKAKNHLTPICGGVGRQNGLP